MNRGFLIILVPAVLVALGYVVVFHYIGIAPGYLRLAGLVVVFLGGIWWLRRRQKKRAGAASGT